MSEENKYRPNIAAIIAGIVMIGIGGLIVFGVFSRTMDRPGRSSVEWLIFLAPALMVSGCVTIVRGFLPGATSFSSWTVLATGLIMLTVGAFPWVYTPMLTSDRPGGESAGMLGTIICLLVGVPGLILTVVGGVMKLLGRG